MNDFNIDDLVSVNRSIIEFIKNQNEVIIDKYSGKGGSGELFFGTHNILNSRVALKFYYVGNTESAHEEAKLLHEIKHENVLEVYDAKIIDDEYAYFLTPEISGGDLDKFMATYFIDTFTAFDIIKGILNGLTALQGAPYRLVHRDLKPANILIDENDNPIIADFGSIKHIPEDSEFVSGSRHAFIYRPPESIERDEYSFQSDIYQVGIILFQLLEGYFPYDEEGWLNRREKKVHSQIEGEYERQKYFDSVVGKKICKGKLLNYQSLPSYVCRRLKRVIGIATNSEIEKRFKTTSEFLKSIHDYLGCAANWWGDEDCLYAQKGDKSFKVIKKSGKQILQQLCKDSKWRSKLKHSESIDQICKYVNNL